VDWKTDYIDETLESKLNSNATQGKPETKPDSKGTIKRSEDQNPGSRHASFKKHSDDGNS